MEACPRPSRLGWCRCEEIARAGEKSGACWQKVTGTCYTPRTTSLVVSPDQFLPCNLSNVPVTSLICVVCMYGIQVMEGSNQAAEGRWRLFHAALNTRQKCRALNPGSVLNA